EDLTYYYAVSEQTPSSVALGVLMSKDNTVAQAGGFILQLMPGASDEIIDKLETKLAGITSVTSMLSSGKSPEMILEELLGEFDLEIMDKMPVQFYCNCSRERVEKALISIGRDEIQAMIDDGKPVELKCHFCNKAYEFSVEELGEILGKI
ncbi:MAG: Hsp33 family molecular chaperone HslO, partial [Thermoflexaceae bacterium]|nr:Hsp33 family molecular chaperone HslO [Thermoflexaceae bacterium]